MKIIYFGSAHFGIPCLEAIHHSNHKLAGVFTQPARPAGRHRSKPHHTDVDVWCGQNDVPCVEAENINAPEMVSKLKDLQPDLIVVIAFGQKVSQEVVGLPQFGAINVHASLLPAYRGAAPIHWAIMNGETQTGVSIITLAEKMDAGLILAQEKIDILPDDTIKSVYDKLAALSVPVLLQTIDQLSDGTVVYQEQDPALVTHAPKLKKEDGYINWDNSSEQIVRQIHALWPWPAAESVYVCSRTGKHWRVGISQARAVERTPQNTDVTGTLDENLNVICGQGALQILELKPAGSKLMDFESYVNGHQCCPGDLFISADKAMSGVL